MDALSASDSDNAVFEKTLGVVHQRAEMLLGDVSERFGLEIDRLFNTLKISRGVDLGLPTQEKYRDRVIASADERLKIEEVDQIFYGDFNFTSIYNCVADDENNNEQTQSTPDVAAVSDWVCVPVLR
jgi:hypothetical protein